MVEQTHTGVQEVCKLRTSLAMQIPFMSTRDEAGRMGIDPEDSNRSFGVADMKRVEVVVLQVYEKPLIH